jgi:DNA-binding MarR family transcriptional regulator
MRNSVIEDLYRQLNAMIRRSRELSNDLHPGLSLVGYTFLSMVDTTPALRASDLAERLGLDKSTVSRQLNQLFEQADADRVRARLTRWLQDWEEDDIAAFGVLMGRFNDSVDASPTP